jgi:hypothetical protein
MSDTEARADFAFAELVRQQAFRIASLARSGRGEEASEAALSLCSQAAERKREILGVVATAPAEDEVYTDPDNDWNLAELEKLGGAPSPE